VEVETAVEYTPENFQQMAGLIFYYDTDDYVYLRITTHETLGKCIGINESKHGVYDELLDQDIPLKSTGEVKIKAKVDQQWLQFAYAEEDEWKNIGSKIDISHLSDDDADYIRFTGTFVGICTQDLSGQKKPSYFSYFKYDEL
jgi:xylan 1,4-beta-xylosidase